MKKIILLGSGGLSIGQAGEFDYSGTQAIKALTEEGIEVVVVNPNIATVQTDLHPLTKIYLYPVLPKWVEKIIEIEKPCGIIAGFGGQTALTCLLDLDDSGVLEKFGVKNLGSSPETIRNSEDRQKFASLMERIGMPVPLSAGVKSLTEALEAAEKITYPVIVRAGYALGGLSSGFAQNELELKELVTRTLSLSSTVLVEKSLQGWKELEYEIMRDSQGNAICICNMENVDPLGIHTGDSIVVAPSQTLSDFEFQKLRTAALEIAANLKIIGECNVQFALDPSSSRFYVIEVNARLSRSSALASKATGYPIAYIAAKVVIGHSLVDLKNPVTETTSAFFEPALDYIVIKIPKWDLTKFPGVPKTLGSGMKSVGEVMGIGRTFTEAIQKASRMVTENALGLSVDIKKCDLEGLASPTDMRPYLIMNAFRQGESLEQVYDKTLIDRWFLSQFEEMVKIEKEIEEIGEAFEKVTEVQWRKWKESGFSDEQIAGIALRNTGCDFQQASFILRKIRLSLGVRPVSKRIDTTAGEHLSHSNYIFLTYSGRVDEVGNDERRNGKKSALILGGGAYRIGTSVEFDWCAVSCAEKMKELGWDSIMLNCNPETVSTDYNSSARLYFEEFTLERILDILELEKSQGVIVAMGGQLPNKLAKPLADLKIEIFGHSQKAIDQAEDRNLFSALLDRHEIGQPLWVSAKNEEEVHRFISKVGFPVLVRPSYVLSGVAMKVAHTLENLNNYLLSATDVSPNHPVVISKFLEGAKEVEVDGVALNGECILSIVSEHIENAGVHSGDATIVTPPQTLSENDIGGIETVTRKIVNALSLNGPFNIQFLITSDKINVIECNARASRTFPFVSKAYGKNLIHIATEAILTGKTGHIPRTEILEHVAVKAPVFSFNRLAGADPILGVEMLSTGEVGCLAPDFDQAILLAAEASGIRLPQKGILLSTGRNHEKEKFLEIMPALEKLGKQVFATPGTCLFLEENGYKVTPLEFPGQGPYDVTDAIRNGLVDFVINLPKNFENQELSYGTEIRRVSMQYGCSLLTNIEKAIALFKATEKFPDLAKHDFVRHLGEFFNSNHHRSFYLTSELSPRKDPLFPGSPDKNI